MTGFVKKDLPEIINSLPIELISCGELPGIQVCGVTDNSREVKPGTIFVAVRGMTTDGHRYIPQAITQGAIAVVGTDPIQDLPVPYVQVRDAREALAYLAASFYGNPAHEMTMIGVTGTDGKTTTSNLIYQILLSAGIPVGIISTVNAMIGKEVVDTGYHVTTPHAPDIHQYLSRMRAAGLTHGVLEVTSHGMAQHRVTGCEFDISVLTNITHEHLNDHGSFEAYRDAKTGLLAGLSQRPDKPNGVRPLAVLNLDDSSYDYVHQKVAVRQVNYSMRPGADVWADNIQHDANGLHFVANGPGFCIPVDCQIMGLFNVSNCLAAICATVLGLGIDPEAARQGIANLKGVPGRMEQISMGQPFISIVDFAHTPNALKQALTFARQMAKGRVIAVFGSAGLRDREKRRMMAEVSGELADISILTAEDPRTESLDGILEEMAAGVRSRGGVEGKSFFRVRDRGNAIRTAVQMAKEGDLVIACGKGHEQSMCFGTTEYPWDDRTAMRAALAELLHATGPQMPYLPTQDET
ncbi:MAG: UDP-N-acetylmuramoyl-L-alanyl-D-glutamate--2,6-diaminopimelate ligase [Chloroflexi bacterium]|nr:UDP-N-acetylmuramoyl-L-alanyl-D-glutamate--2,6-diaminopimelate ligase [Chloroflexota bacterium]